MFLWLYVAFYSIKKTLFHRPYSHVSLRKAHKIRLRTSFLKYLFFFGLGNLLFFPLLLFRSSLFFFVLFVVLFLLSFLGGGLLCSIILFKRETAYVKQYDRRSQCVVSYFKGHDL